MVWPFTMSFAALLCAVSWGVGNGYAFRCSLPILGGYLMARVIMWSPINGDYNDVVFSAMWVAVATLIPLGGRDKAATSLLVKASIYAAVICVMWARVGRYEFELGVIPYVIADLMVIVAMLLIGWSLRHDIIGRIGDLFNNSGGNVSMGRNHRVPDSRSANRQGGTCSLQGVEAPQVRRNV